MMDVLAKVRARHLCRAAISAPLTVGQIGRLCIAVLSLPTFESFDGPLHPVLASLFRVTDGLRIVVHQMMFVPSAEPMLPPETLVTAAGLYDGAERSLSFHCDTGVCTGPQHFTAECLAAIVEGSALRFGAGGQIGPAAMGAPTWLDAAFDYGFAALSARAATFAIWPHMAEAWAQIAALDLPEPWRAEADEAARRLEHASCLWEPGMARPKACDLCRDGAGCASSLRPDLTSDGGQDHMPRRDGPPLARHLIRASM